MRIRYVGHGSFSLKYNKQVCVSCNHVTQLQLELVAEARGCDLCPSPSAVTEVRAVRAAEFRCVIFPFADTLHRYKQTLSERAFMSQTEMQTAILQTSAWFTISDVIGRTTVCKGLMSQPCSPFTARLHTAESYCPSHRWNYRQVCWLLFLSQYWSERSWTRVSED